MPSDQAYDTPDDVLASKIPTPEQTSAQQAEFGGGDDFDDEGEEGTQSEAEAEVPPPAEPAASGEDPFAAYGGKQVVEDALTLARAYMDSLDADDGEDEDEAGEEYPDFFDGIQDDDYLTGAQVKDLFGSFAERVEAAIQQYVEGGVAPIEQTIQAQRQAVANDAARGTLEALGVRTPGAQQAVLMAAGAYLADGDWDPRHVSEAIRKGHAEIIGNVESERQGYIEEKKGQKSRQPGRLGRSSAAGAGSSGGPEPEPKDLNEAFARMRRRRAQEG